MKRVLIIVVLLINTMLLANPAVDAKIERLEKMVAKLQKSLEINNKIDDDVEAEMIRLQQHSLKMNGYINSYYVAYAGVDNENKKDGFHLEDLSFIPHQQVNEKLRWLSEIEFEDLPRLESNGTASGTLSSESTGKIFVERAYIQYAFNSKLKLRVGRDFLHSTIYSDNHYPAFVLNQLRPYLERKIFPAITDGIELMGNFDFDETAMDYIIYYGNGNVYKADSDVNTQDLVGMRVRLSLPYFKMSRLSLALAQGYTSDTAVPNSYKKQSIAVGLEEKIGAVSLTLQYAKSDITEVSSFSREGYYTRLSYSMGRVTPWIYYEAYDASDKDNQVKQERASVGLEYALTKEYKIRLEHYNSYDVSSSETILAFILNF